MCLSWGFWPLSFFSLYLSLSLSRLSYPLSRNVCAQVNIAGLSPVSTAAIICRSQERKFAQHFFSLDQKAYK